MRFKVTDLWNPTHILEKSCFFQTKAGDQIKHGAGLKIRVYVQHIWGPKHTLMDLVFGLKIGPKLEDRFLKLAPSSPPQSIGWIVGYMGFLQVAITSSCLLEAS